MLTLDTKIFFVEAIWYSTLDFLQKEPLPFKMPKWRKNMFKVRGKMVCFILEGLLKGHFRVDEQKFKKRTLFIQFLLYFLLSHLWILMDVPGCAQGACPVLQGKRMCLGVYRVARSPGGVHRCVGLHILAHLMWAHRMCILQLSKRAAICCASFSAIVPSAREDGMTHVRCPL